MSARYVAVKDEDAHAIIDALERMKIKHEYYGHDEIWSVIKMHNFDRVSNDQRTYDAALKLVGVVE